MRKKWKKRSNLGTQDPGPHVQSYTLVYRTRHRDAVMGKAAAGEVARANLAWGAAWVSERGKRKTEKWARRGGVFFPVQGT